MTRSRRSSVYPASVYEKPAQDAPISEFVTVQEIVAEWRVSKMTVYRLIDAGVLPATRIGRSVRVRRSSVDAYLRSVSS